MNELEGIRWQLGHYRSALQMQMDRLYNALEELQRTTLMLLNPDAPTAEDIDQWLEEQGFAVDEDGFFQSLPLLRAFREGRAPEDAISISWGKHLRSNKTARRHLYLHRNIGSHLKHIHDRLGDDLGWIYYQDAANVSLQYPYIDQRTAISSDFDWSAYHTFVSACPENNPEHHIRWTPPTIDYAGEGLILSVSIPVWRHDHFVGLWSIDLPLRFLYRDFISSKTLPEQMQFIVNQEGLLVLHDKLKATVDQPHGKVFLHPIAELGGQWKEVDIAALTAQGDGQLEVTDGTGREWVFCYSHIAGVEWTLFCGLHKQAMEEAAAQRLRLAFQQIASGNYSHRIESSPTNALPVLVDEFNKMSRRLGEAEEHRKEIEDQLFQAQKMEAVGRLAGGVAHDYNNMINVIMGFTELALENVDPKDQLYDDLQEIYNAAQRSMILTRQLLAFARRQSIAPKVLDINKTVNSMIKMLQHLIGEDIKLIWNPATKVWPIKIDPTQIDQILANLCVNARDAISGVGKLIIETANTVLDEAFCAKHQGCVPGEYVRLAVSDDGVGMDTETQKKIFEPFYSTKAIGKGTGLGLATIYGIVKQNNGFINVQSEPGVGSTFTVFFPRTTAKSVDILPTDANEIPYGHNETVLLVEDEIAILKLAERMLQKLGYQVIPVSSAKEAITIVEHQPVKPELLLTDVIMPELNGRDLADRLRSLCPALRVLFMSGYASDVIVHRGVLDEDVNLIQKPFSISELAAKMREVLDKPDAPQE